MDNKTNVMRMLEQKKLPYQKHSYEVNDKLSGAEIAQRLGRDPDHIFKTLVTHGKTGAYYVFVVPVNRELSLKKAAKAVAEKSIAMLPQRELLPLTGYVHGGCSPIGMKKLFRTTLHETAIDFETICFSAGRVGCQVEMRPEDLRKLIPFTYADVCDDV